MRRRIGWRGDERDPLQQDFLARLSPLQQVDKIRVPLLLAHGLNDPRVLVGETEQMKRALRDRAVECWYLLAEDEGHNFENPASLSAYKLTMVQFRKDSLALAPRF